MIGPRLLKEAIKPEAALRHFTGVHRYGPVQIVVSTALWLANFANLRSSPRGVQLFALFQRGSP